MARLPPWFPGDARPVGVLLDYDGTLSEIAPTPEDARAVRGAPTVLRRLVRAGAVVVAVSGRRAADVAARLGGAVRCFGLYGLEDERGPLGDGEAMVAATEAALPAVERAAAMVPGSRVEPKGLAVAVHYRGAPDGEAARRVLLERLAPVAEAHGFRLVEGKKVVELAGASAPRKGDVVSRVAAEAGLRAVLYAGDDLADLSAFEAVRRVARAGSTGLAVAVRSAETPEELLRAADLVVDGPAALLSLLGELEARL